GADDYRELLVVAAATQGADDGPGCTAADQHQDHAQYPEDQDGGARFIGIVQEEDGGHDQQRQQQTALEDSPHFFAEAAQTADVVLSGQPVGDGAEHPQQRHAAPAQVKRRDHLFHLNPAGLEAQIVSQKPGGCSQNQIGEQKAGSEQLAALMNHDLPRPWG